MSIATGLGFDAAELNHWLERLEHPEGPCVHPRVVTFPSDQQKVNWPPSLPDVAHRDTIPHWYSTRKGGKVTWLALASTWVQNWVGNKDWAHQPWRVWGIAVIKAPDVGKHVFIWDPEPVDTRTEDKRLHQFLHPVQNSLLKYARNKARMRSLFYNTSNRYAGQGSELEQVQEWLQFMIRHGDSPLQKDKEGRCNDPRTVDMVEARRW